MKLIEDHLNSKGQSDCYSGTSKTCNSNQGSSCSDLNDLQFIESSKFTLKEEHENNLPVKSRKCSNIDDYKNIKLKNNYRVYELERYDKHSLDKLIGISNKTSPKNRDQI